MTGKTHHACALEINQTGILIKGCSGSGKTSLMLGLLERAKLDGFDAYLICDDQVLLNSTPDSLIAKAPKTISGLVEIRGYGIISHPHKPATLLRLIVELIEDGKIERMPEQKFSDYGAIRLPLIEVPQRHENQAVRIIFAWLGENACLQV